MSNGNRHIQEFMVNLLSVLDRIVSQARRIILCEQDRQDATLDLTVGSQRGLLNAAHHSQFPMATRVEACRGTGASFTLQTTLHSLKLGVAPDDNSLDAQAIYFAVCRRGPG